MKIEWLDEAREDLISLYAWNARERSIKTAKKISKDLLKDVRRIAKEPLMGRIEPLLEGLEYEFRTMVAKSGNHKIIYFIDENILFVYRLWDCRQDPPKLRSGFLKRKNKD